MSESVICEICGREFKNNIGLVSHINKSEKLSSKEYYNLYLKKDNEEFCCECGKLCNFINIKEGYRDFCSLQCSTKSKKTREKIENTNLERHGEKHYFQTELGKEKIKDIIKDKYGVDNVAKNDDIKEKIKETCKIKYGVDHPLKNDKIKERGKKTNLERYGVEVSTQNKDVLEKRKNNIIKKYGGPAPVYDPKVKEKMEKTNILRYGVKNYSNSIIERKKRYKIIVNNEIKKYVKPMFNSEDYTIASENYKWKCKKCGNIFESNLSNSKIPRCNKCFPNIYGTSYSEQQVSMFIESFYSGEIIRNDRKILKDINKELDIYIPDKNLAIEFDGLHWHSEFYGKDSKYHLEKTLECEKQNIKLIHIFEDEWIEKRNIIKSIIKNKMGYIFNKIPSCKCEIKKLDNNKASKFLNNNHIQGHIPGKYYGLFYNDELVQACGIGKPRFNNKYDWELLRVCAKLETVVNGGLSKLLNYIMKEYLGSYITYSDIRYEDGLEYLDFGFECKEKTNPDYFYIKERRPVRYSRNKFQKHKLEKILENYNSELSEYENMLNNNYYRIWDCGNNVYIRK